MSLQPQVYESPITINDVTGTPFPDLKQLYYIPKKKSALYNFKEEIMRLFVSVRYRLERMTKALCETASAICSLIQKDTPSLPCAI